MKNISSNTGKLKYLLSWRENLLLKKKNTWDSVRQCDNEDVTTKQDSSVP